MAMNTAIVHVIGHIWQPGIGLCAQSQKMRGEEMDRVKWPTHVDRDAVMDWANIAFGDFREIVDVSLTFQAPVGVPDLDWQNADSEAIYSECMFSEDDD